MLESKDKVIKLIQKLANMRIDRGATPAEAAHAAAKIESLLEEHQLSMFDVEGKSFNEEMAQKSVELGVSLSVIPRYIWDLGYAVAMPHDCQIIVMPSQLKGNNLTFVGYKSDVAVSRYLFITLHTSLWRMADTQGRVRKRSGAQFINYRNHFMSAAAQVIEERLTQERRDVRQKSSNSRALVVVKKDAVNKYFEEQFPGCRPLKLTKSDRDDYAYHDGREAGRNVEMRKGVEGQHKQQALEAKKKEQPV